MGLPEGATVEDGLLQFNRPLKLTDTGVYECTAINVVSSGKHDLNITVTGMCTFLLLCIIKHNQNENV